MGVAFRGAMLAAAKAGGEYGTGRGPAAATVQALRRLGWSARDAHHWASDAGEELHLLVGSPWT
eukprot:4765633-Lingulodinium_polyedra.AAC.1